jgi:hypothetical protein
MVYTECRLANSSGFSLNKMGSRRIRLLYTYFLEASWTTPINVYASGAVVLIGGAQDEAHGRLRRRSPCSKPFADFSVMPHSCPDRQDGARWKRN